MVADREESSAGILQWQKQEQDARSVRVVPQLHDRHLPTEPIRVSLGHGLQKESGWRRLLHSSVERIFYAIYILLVVIVVPETNLACVTRHLLTCERTVRFPSLVVTCAPFCVYYFNAHAAQGLSRGYNGEECIFIMFKLSKWRFFFQSARIPPTMGSDQLSGGLRVSSRPRGSSPNQPFHGSGRHANWRAAHQSAAGHVHWKRQGLWIYIYIYIYMNTLENSFYSWRK